MKLSSLTTNVGDLTLLTELYLSGNQLTDLPTTLSKLVNLTLLRASSNLFTQFPIVIPQLKSLTTLDLSNNSITSLPNELFNVSLPSLRQIILENNYITGTVPASLLNHPQIADIKLNNNEFSQIPVNYFNSPRLISLDLSYNKLTGSLPQLPNTSFVGVINLSNNELTGTIPISYYNYTDPPQLNLYLQYNQLSGSIMYPFKGYNKLSLSDNLMNGTLPQNFFVDTMAASIDLSRNNFSGAPLETTSPNGGLVSLHLSNNSFTGSIYGIVYFNSLISLDLSINKFYGTLPNISQLSYLRSMEFSNNRLEGTIPDDYQLMFQIEFLGLATNVLNGTIPPSIYGLTTLRGLALSDNDLEGSVSSVINDMYYLEYLSLEANKFSCLSFSPIISPTPRFPNGIYDYTTDHYVPLCFVGPEGSYDCTPSSCDRSIWNGTLCVNPCADNSTTPPSLSLTPTLTPSLVLPIPTPAPATVKKPNVTIINDTTTISQESNYNSSVAVLNSSVVIYDSVVRIDGNFSITNSSVGISSGSTLNITDSFLLENTSKLDIKIDNNFASSNPIISVTGCADIKGKVSVKLPTELTVSTKKIDLIRAACINDGAESKVEIQSSCKLSASVTRSGAFSVIYVPNFDCLAGGSSVIHPVMLFIIILVIINVWWC
eukprot:TRINITY_DN4495_c0_g1_i3.p1 TRINITY_DN4495_c0_g1~~TRINITY_DN4495_c0_g1_i3.p1  ORF type:complete len:658 (+),score=67.36 TRINITY_DN4495_c0_g1_i3:146-2119(+)